MYEKKSINRVRFQKKRTLENLFDYDEDTSYSSLYTLVEKVKKDFAEVLQRRKAQAKRKKPIQSEEEVVPPSD